MAVSSAILSVFYCLFFNRVDSVSCNAEQKNIYDHNNENDQNGVKKFRPTIIWLKKRENYYKYNKPMSRYYK